MIPLIDERCPKCNKLLGRIKGMAEIKCPRCGNITNIDNLQPNIKKSVMNATK